MFSSALPLRTVLVATALASLGLSSPAVAGTAQTSFGVSATVQSACVASANALAFGSYDPMSATPTNGTTTIAVTCTPGTSFTVGLNAGTTSGATVAARQMASGTHRLQYTLFSDASRTTNWGNTPGTDTPGAVSATGTAQSLTVYGQVPAQQIVTAGAYSDTVTVTINY